MLVDYQDIVNFVNFLCVLCGKEYRLLGQPHSPVSPQITGSFRPQGGISQCIFGGVFADKHFFNINNMNKPSGMLAKTYSNRNGNKNILAGTAASPNENKNILAETYATLNGNKNILAENAASLN